MEATTGKYRIGMESVVDYLADIERRWGCIVTIDLRIKEVRPFMGALFITIGVPHEEHQRELDNPPIITFPVTKSGEQDITWAMWDGLYQWDRALSNHLGIPDPL